MAELQLKNDGYKVKNLKDNEEFECPDKDTSIKKIGHNIYRIILKKGNFIRSE